MDGWYIPLLLDVWWLRFALHVDPSYFGGCTKRCSSHLGCMYGYIYIWLSMVGCLISPKQTSSWCILSIIKKVLFFPSNKQVFGNLITVEHISPIIWPESVAITTTIHNYPENWTILQSYYGVRTSISGGPQTSIVPYNYPIYLVGGLNPLKNMKVSWESIIPHTWKVIKFINSKPPTSDYQPTIINHY